MIRAKTLLLVNLKVQCTTSTAKCLGLRKLSLLSCDVDGYGGGGVVAVAMA